MSKPDDIPQDVWDVAVYALHGSAPTEFVEKRIVITSRCARAILAERQRCVDVIDAEREWEGDLLEVRRRAITGLGPRQIPGWNAPSED